MDFIRGNLDYLQYRANSWKFSDPNYSKYVKEKEAQALALEQKAESQPEAAGTDSAPAKESVTPEKPSMLSAIFRWLIFILYFVGLGLTGYKIWELMTKPEKDGGYGMSAILTIVIMFVSIMIWANPLGIIVILGAIYYKSADKSVADTISSAADTISSAAEKVVETGLALADTEETGSSGPMGPPPESSSATEESAPAVSAAPAAPSVSESNQSSLESDQSSPESNQANLSPPESSPATEESAPATVVVSESSQSSLESNQPNQAPPESSSATEESAPAPPESNQSSLESNQPNQAPPESSPATEEAAPAAPQTSSETEGGKTTGGFLGYHGLHEFSQI